MNKEFKIHWMEDWVDEQMDRSCIFRLLASIFIFLGGFLTRDSVRDSSKRTWLSMVYNKLRSTPGTVARDCDVAVWFSGPVGGIHMS